MRGCLRSISIRGVALLCCVAVVLYLTVAWRRGAASDNDAPTARDSMQSRGPGVPLFRAGDCRPFCERRKLKGLLKDFERVYAGRPHRVNKCGCTINHAFATYAIARLLQPSVVIENGVNAGMTTYLLRQALPHARIISLDPLDKPICDANMERWRNPTNSEYLTGASFVDFHQVDWDARLGPATAREDVLVFFDTHVSDYNNLRLARQKGFRWFFFDDNFPGHNTGDMNGMSLKQVLSRRDSTASEAVNIIDMYYEMPPLVWIRPPFSEPHTPGVAGAQTAHADLLRRLPGLAPGSASAEYVIDAMDPPGAYTEPLLDAFQPDDTAQLERLYALIGLQDEFLWYNHMCVVRTKPLTGAE